jgi:hypothetical protein
MTKSSVRQKSIARQNYLRGKALCAAHRKFFSAPLKIEMEIINENLHFETDPWIF